MSKYRAACSEAANLTSFLPIAFLLLALIAVGPGVTGAGERDPLAEVRLNPQGIQLEPMAESEGWSLAVSGPEDFYRYRNFRRKGPELSLVGSEGESPPDGPYTWELRARPEDGRTQVGHFRVRDGRIWLPDPALVENSTLFLVDTEAPRQPSDPTAVATHVDGVIIDNNLIARNGACIGEACLDAEVVGFLSLKLKEDNISLKFEDTSITSTFPTTDWQIKVNDSAVDGAEYFRIQELDAGTDPFTIEAGAASNSIWVDESGKVGIGTATPSNRLHVQGNARVTGNLTVLSSRDAKTGIVVVDTREMLRRLLDLRLAEWSLAASPGERHLGPMAEDFRDSFGLGPDDHYLSPADLAGVTMAALQGLHREVQDREIEAGRALRERDAEIAELRRDRDDLTARLELLESAVRELRLIPAAAGGPGFPPDGDSVPASSR